MKFKHSFKIIPALTADLDANEVEKIRKDPQVETVEPDYKIYAFETSASGQMTSFAGTQTVPYGVNMVDAPAAWSKSRGAGVRVAVLDTGISMFHPDRGNVAGAMSFVPDEAVEDFGSHGTHTSGTIGAADNGIGVVGVAPEAELLIGKVLGNDGSGQDSWLIQGIEWAVENNAKVINMSLGGPDNSSALELACNNAFAGGVLLVAAAGNDGVGTPNYPAALGAVVSISAVDQNKNRASFSNYGASIELAAPGAGVYSTFPVSEDGTAEAIWSNINRQANIVMGTAAGIVSGNICNCGLATGTDAANTCPDIVAGKIAHVRRGVTTFAEKVAHAASKGAKGVIISNNETGNFDGTLNGGSPLVVVSVSKADGDQLQSFGQLGPGGLVRVNASLYGYNDGTSMACPHVAGAAALIFGAAGINTSPGEVRSILFNSAQDLGAAGWDEYFGYGLVNAADAMELVVPNACSEVWNMGYGLAADLDRDCVVGVKDVRVLAGQWLNSCGSGNGWCVGSDFNQSGTVNFADFSGMAAQWLNCNDPVSANCP